ncbi:DUF1579 domain-containing protein [bacterium]|nr:DUF1579 domain-containing protein [bacterium]
MKRSISFLLVVLLGLPVMAQEMVPPKALDDDFLKWMIGDWEGWTEGPMGKTKDWLKYELGLDGQFLLLQATSEGAAMSYRGMGAVTLNPETGEIVGNWVDNFRGMYHGVGKREGNKLVIQWEGKTGKSTRTTEKIGENKFRVVAKSVGPDGSTMESKGTFTRKKISDKKTE